MTDDKHDDELRYGVMGPDPEPGEPATNGGAGWGRYKTLEEALARADSLGQASGREFAVMKRVSSSAS